MSEISELLTSPVWWFSQVFVALIVGVIAGKISLKPMRLRLQLSENLVIFLKVGVGLIVFVFIFYAMLLEGWHSNPEVSLIRAFIAATIASFGTTAVVLFAIYSYLCSTILLLFLSVCLAYFSGAFTSDLPWQVLWMFCMISASMFSLIIGRIIEIATGAEGDSNHDK